MSSLAFTSPGFVHYQLRTTQPDAARRFYDGLISDELMSIVALPQQASAAGAPSHFLGQVFVDDVSSALAAWVQHGAVVRGSTARGADGYSEVAVLDPVGVMVALTDRPHPNTSSPPYVWHELHSTDHVRALAMYGWHLNRSTELPSMGSYDVFSWRSGTPELGGMISSAGKNGTHPHWLFYFPVEDLQAACARVIERGGTARGPVPVPGGAMVAMCHDKQGAAFGLQLPSPV